MGCRPASIRLITIRMRATPFNITIIQIYTPTSMYEDSEVEDFYDQLQAALDQAPKKDIIIVQGDKDPKVGDDSYAIWKDICSPYGNTETNDRGLRLLGFARYNNLLLVNTLGPHKASRRWTWHSPGGDYYNQIDYILLKSAFAQALTPVGRAAFEEQTLGVTTTSSLCLLPEVAEDFKAMIGGRFLRHCSSSA